MIDAAWRIAGTGSLGGVRIAVLVRGERTLTAAWVFDMKEQGDPSAYALLGRPVEEVARLAPADARAERIHARASAGARRASPGDDDAR